MLVKNLIDLLNILKNNNVEEEITEDLASGSYLWYEIRDCNISHDIFANRKHIALKVNFKHEKYPGLTIVTLELNKPAEAFHSVIYLPNYCMRYNVLSIQDTNKYEKRQWFFEDDELTNPGKINDVNDHLMNMMISEFQFSEEFVNSAVEKISNLILKYI